jgi:hypothetical protein
MAAYFAGVDANWLFRFHLRIVVDFAAVPSSQVECSVSGSLDQPIIW